MPRNHIYYDYKKDRKLTHSIKGGTEKFTIPKSSRYMLLYDCQDTILLFLEELVNEFEKGGFYIGDCQIEDAKKIKELIKEFRENDCYILTPYEVSPKERELKVREFWGEVGVLLQGLWI